MNNDEKTYVTVKEFADMTGKTTQAIYKRIKEPSMLEFVKIKNGHTLISTDALDLFNIKTADKPIKKDLQSNVILPSNVSWAFDILIEQLATKDVQIAAKDAQIAELNARLKEANQLYQNNHLLLGTQDKKLK
ncbi:hypothetical protein [Acetobacterium sp.]|uniref:helix-turn-helix transcriptional regulator n=1 Tax=Acetobacterium sp. TaxID=1872094 RepID=UPI002F4297F7